MADLKHGPDAFERAIKDSLDQFEVPYNSSDWADLEKALDGPRNVSWWTRPGMIAALVAGTLLVGGATYLLVDDARPTTNELTAQPATPAGNDRAAAQAPAVDPSVDRPQASGTGHDRTIPSSGPSATSNEAMEEQRTASQRPSNVQPPSAPTSGQAFNRTGTPAPKPGAEPGRTATEAPKPNTEMSFRASVSDACSGEEVTFVVENMPKDGIYLWNFGDGSFSNKPNPEHTFTKPGTYQVMLSMSAAGVGSIHNKPSSNIITIHEAPKANFHALKQEFEGHIPSVHFENRSSGGKEYHWDFGDGSTSVVAHPDHVYKKSGVYPVKLSVTSELGCVDIYEKEVRIDKDYNLDAPPAFAPAQAETFMPEALRTLGVKFRLMVYTADGELVYETSDATKPWTGRRNNRGEVMAGGEYVWVVDVRESLHLSETYTGKVMLKH